MSFCYVGLMSCCHVSRPVKRRDRRSCQEGQSLCQDLVSWDLFFCACHFCSFETVDLAGFFQYFDIIFSSDHKIQKIYTSTLFKTKHLLKRVVWMSLQTLINNDEGNDEPGDDTAPDEDTDLDLYSQYLGAQSLLLNPVIPGVWRRLLGLGGGTLCPQTCFLILWPPRVSP